MSVHPSTADVDQGNGLVRFVPKAEMELDGELTSDMPEKP
jgi:hypothetical protein